MILSVCVHGLCLSKHHLHPIFVQKLGRSFVSCQHPHRNQLEDPSTVGRGTITRRRFSNSPLELGVQRSKWHFVTVQTPSHELSFGISSGGWPTSQLSQVFKARAVQQPNKAAAQVHMNVFRPPHHTPPPPPPPLA